MFLPQTKSKVPVLYGDNIGFYTESGLRTECFGIGMSVTCFVQAVEWLAVDVTHDIQLFYSFSSIMLMQFFYLTTPLRVGAF